MSLTHLIEAVRSKFDDDGLDEFVHDAKGHEAAAINNAGLEDQVEYLVEFHGGGKRGEEAVRKLLFPEGDGSP